MLPTAERSGLVSLFARNRLCWSEHSILPSRSTTFALTSDFCRRFYHVALSDAQIAAVLDGLG